MSAFGYLVFSSQGCWNQSLSIAINYDFVLRALSNVIQNGKSY
jgi:hypothetical protein